MPLLSIIIPAYNEEGSIGALLERVLQVNTKAVGMDREILVVNDGSKDGTAAVAEGVAARHEQVRVFTQVPNQGKGRSVQRGIAESKGDYILIQDADLEYDPEDYIPMIQALFEQQRKAPGQAASIYGSRGLGQMRQRKGFTLFWGRHPEQRFGPWLAGQILSACTWLLYGQWITDTLTAYKLYPGDVMRSMNIKTRGFETDHEITAKLLRQGVVIDEVPVAYHPRGLEEGKKIRPVDGLIAVWTLLRYRFGD